VANVRLAQQDYYSAIQLYQACLRRHHQNKDATVLLYLARCAGIPLLSLVTTCSDEPGPDNCRHIHPGDGGAYYA